MVRLATVWLLLVQVLFVHPDTRTKPGPVTIRGVASSVSRGGFTLRSPSKGSFSVTVTPDTAISEKGRGRVRLADGDHVGVRGFLGGRRIRAISVHVYPTVPKPFSFRGHIVSVTGGSIAIRAGRLLRVWLTHATTVMIGSRPGGAAALRAGDKVLVRVVRAGGRLVVLHIHVYRRKPPRRHVELLGTLAAVRAADVTVRGGTGSETVHLTSATVIYVGAVRRSWSALHPGQSVRVYACCAGGPLTATSIHVRAAPSRPATHLARGVVTALAPDHLVLAGLTVWIAPATVFELGLRRVNRSALRLGDHVSVRYFSRGGRLIATRIHVYVQFRQVHTYIGTVAAARPNGLILLFRAKRLSVSISAQTRVTLNGRSVASTALKVGDHVRVRGTAGPATILAVSVTATRSPPPTHTLHGTVARVTGDALTLRDSSGVNHRVRLTASTRLLIHGAPAPRSALFPGARVTVRVTSASAGLVASTISLTLTIRKIQGWLRRPGRQTLVLASGSGRMTAVDVPTGLRALDDGRKITPVHLQAGGLLRVRGYSTGKGRIRAFRITVLHPTLDIAGTVIVTGPEMKVRTSGGATFRIRVTASTTLQTGTEHVDLALGDIPAGIHVHVAGKLGSDGELEASAMTVRLVAVTVRGTISAIAPGVLTVSIGGPQMVKVGPSTRLSQGSHDIGFGDLVVGDDVTVAGYRGATAILARQVAVHRKLTALDGVVESTSAGGFTLLVAGVTVRVIIGPGTAITANLVVGASVHVTGYRRGDGAILATRVVPVKKHKT
jgi:hypothetical protein